MKKNSIRVCCSCAAAVFIAAGVFAAVNTGLFRPDKPPAPTEQPQQAEVIETSADTANDIAVNWYTDGSWQENGKVCEKVLFSLTNTGTQTINDWCVVAQVSEGTEVSQLWNGEAQLNGTELTIRPASYNSVIEPGASVDPGGIFKSLNGFVCSVTAVYSGGAALSVGTVPDTAITVQTTPEPVYVNTVNPVGRLSVSGTKIVNEQGEPVQLKGASTHGLAWYPQYVSRETFSSLRDEWGANTVRLAMYTEEYGGYCSGGDKAALKDLIDKGVNYANELGMYAIIDWHILSDSNPNKHKDEAISFFEEEAAKYAGYDNVLYEICNEPNGGASWEGDIKPYAQDVIAAIRKYDSDAIIIVGTPNWSQDVDTAAKSPITGQSNIMYTMHFYAATHRDDLRNKLKYALDSDLPVFITEFSICEASGNGAADYSSAQAWFDIINQYGVSYVGWNLSNKAESSALFKPECTKLGAWSDDDLTDTAKWLKSKMSEG